MQHQDQQNHENNQFHLKLLPQQQMWDQFSVPALNSALTLVAGWMCRAQAGFLLLLALCRG